MALAAKNLSSSLYLGGCALASTSVLLIAPHFLSSGPAAHAGALAILAIGVWSTRALPEHVTAVGFFLIAALASGAPLPVVFSGFSSPAFWLTFGGLIIGVAINSAGLAKRIARATVVQFGSSYRRAISGAALVGVVMAVIMPSTMGRVVLLIPIIANLAEHLGFAKGSNGRTGMVLSAGFSTYMISAGILPANLPNVILLGLSESLYQLPITYGSYLLLHFPITGFLKVLAIIGLVCIMFPDTPRGFDTRSSLSEVSPKERWLLVVLSGAILLWATDFIHGVSPAWVATGAAIICMLPYPGLVSSDAFNERVNYSALFFVAAFLGLAAIIAESGLGGEIGSFVSERIGLEPGQPWWDFVKLSVLSTIVCLVTTTAGVPAVLTPMAAKLATASGLPLMTVLMTQVFGFSTFLLPYQGAPLLMTMHLGDVRARDAVKFCLALAVLTFVVLLPLNYLWWWVLGYLP